MKQALGLRCIHIEKEQQALYPVRVANDSAFSIGPWLPETARRTGYYTHLEPVPGSDRGFGAETATVLPGP